MAEGYWARAIARIRRLRPRRRGGKPRGMEEQLASYADYLFEVPDIKISLGIALVLSAAFGAVAFPFAVLQGMEAGLLLFFVPAVLATFLTTLVSKVFGENVTNGRAALVSLIMLAIVAVVTASTNLITHVAGRPYTYVGYALALSLIYAMWMLVLLGISVNSLPKVIVPAGLQSLFSALALLFYTRSPVVYIDLVISSVIFISAAFAFVRFVDHPMVKSFGVSSLDFIQDFIAHLTEGSPAMEEFFEKIGESIDAPVNVLSFRKPGGAIKAIVITPYVHPGPMGEIGGGNLPTIVSGAFPEGLVFVPHGTAYHDFNLVSAEESEKVIRAARIALGRVQYSPLASRSCRVAVGNTKVLGQRFDDSLLLVSTQAPTSTEDIEFAVGFTAMAESRVAGARCSTVIDSHNCTEPFATAIEPGTRDSYNIIRAAENASKALLAMPLGSLWLGVASSPPICTRLEGMGDLGIRVAVVEASGQRTAYIVIDGNNMVKGLREEIIDGLPVDEAEVMTTDTHVVNTLSGANYVGQHLDCGLLVDTVAALVDRAIADLEPVEAGMESELATDVTVFGSHKIAKLASTANAMVAMGGAFGVAVIVAALSLTMLILILIQ